MIPKNEKLATILLVEDNLADVRLMKEALRESQYVSKLLVTYDGDEAMNFLRHEEGFENSPRPDLILLDLNLPKKDGREVLAELKSDKDLRRIPVIVLTVSKYEQDILEAYDLHANCYINKPVDFEHFTDVVRDIETFWFSVASLPNK